MICFYLFRYYHLSDSENEKSEDGSHSDESDSDESDSYDLETKDQHVSRGDSKKRRAKDPSHERSKKRCRPDKQTSPTKKYKESVEDDSMILQKGKKKKNVPVESIEPDIMQTKVKSKHSNHENEEVVEDESTDDSDEMEDCGA